MGMSKLKLTTQTNLFMKLNPDCQTLFATNFSRRTRATATGDKNDFDSKSAWIRATKDSDAKWTLRT